MDIFEKNMAVLESHDSMLASTIACVQTGSDLITTSNGPVQVLRVGNISLHSRYNPEMEASGWVRHYSEEIDNSQSVCVLGFGQGYHLKALCSQYTGSIYVIEQRPDIIRKAFETVDLTEVIPRLAVITGDEFPDGMAPRVILEHQPSVKCCPEFYARAKERLKRAAYINNGLRIAVAGPIFGGSLPIAQYCSSALIDLGHQVEFIDCSRFHDDLFLAKELGRDGQRYNRMTDLLTNFASELVMARCEEFEPDIVLALAQAPLTPSGLARFRELGVKTAYWFVEDFRVMNYWRKIAPLYDYFFTIQRGQFLDELREAGAVNMHYLPVAASPRIHQPLHLTDDEKEYYGSDLSFVGAGYFNRRHFFKGLMDYDLKIWGVDWDMTSSLAQYVQRDGERIETNEMVRIFNAAGININLHSSTYHRGVNPFGDFVNPRTFEIIASGGFQLVDRRADLDIMFDPDSEIVIFDGLGDLREKAGYYLDNPDRRRLIAESGRERVLKDHTYKCRMRGMIDLIASGGGDAKWKSSGESLEKLRKQAQGHTELEQFLAGMGDRKRIGLSDIIDEIRSGDGELSRAESMFMLMHEAAI